MTPILVMAGGKAKPELEAVIGQSRRPLAEVYGKTLLRHAIDALLAAGPDGGPLGPIVVVGDLPDSPDYALLPDQGHFVDNLFSGLKLYRDEPKVLLTTADLPYLTASSVEQFTREAIALAHRSEAGLIWPIVPVSSCYARFPGVKRTALKLKEGVYTGGNLALISPRLLLSQQARIAAAYAARKSPARLAGMMGLQIFTRLIASQLLLPRLLSVAQLEIGVSRLMGGTARALICDLPELATDLDRPSDFLAIRSQLPSS